MQNASSAVSDQYEQIVIEQNRAAQQVNLHEVEAMEITADGTMLKALQDQQTAMDAFQAASHGFFSALGSLDDPAALIGGLADGVVGAIAALHQRRNRQGEDQHRYRREGARRIRSGAGAAHRQRGAGQGLLLEIPTLRINALLAEQDIGRLLGQLRPQMQDAQDAAASLSLMQQLSATDPRRDPAFRQYRDEATTLANKAFDDAQGQLFLVTRAFEYEVGMSFSRRGELFTLVTPDELRAYEADLDPPTRISSPPSATRKRAS